MNCCFNISGVPMKLNKSTTNAIRKAMTNSITDTV